MYNYMYLIRTILMYQHSSYQSQAISGMFLLRTYLHHCNALIWVNTQQSTWNMEMKMVNMSMCGQKCVNATRDILMSKARKMTILTITMFNENVHTGCLFFN